MIDGAEPCEVITYSERRARKAHTCSECRRVIEKGETYEYIFYKPDWGRAESKVCAHCLAAREWLDKVCGGWCYEAVAEELQEHFEEGHPYNSMWLGRATVGIRRQWKKKDGSLLPVPPPPPAHILEPLGVKVS